MFILKRSNVSFSLILYGTREFLWHRNSRVSVFRFYNTRYLQISTRWRSWAIVHALWRTWRNVKRLLFCLFPPFNFHDFFFSVWKIAERNYLSVGILKKIWHVQTSTSKVFSNTYHKAELLWRRSVNPMMVFYYQREMERVVFLSVKPRWPNRTPTVWNDLFMKTF